MLFLGRLIPWLLGGLFDFFVNWLGKKWAVSLTAIAAYAALIATLAATFKALMTGLEVVLPPAVTQWLFMMIPANFPLCVSVLLTAKFSVFAYQVLKTKLMIGVQGR